MSATTNVSHSVTQDGRTRQLTAPDNRQDTTRLMASEGSFIRDLPSLYQQTAPLSRQQVDTNTDLMKARKIANWRNPSANAFQSDYFYNNLAMV